MATSRWSSFDDQGEPLQHFLLPVVREEADDGETSSGLEKRERAFLKPEDVINASFKRVTKNIADADSPSTRLFLPSDIFRKQRTLPVVQAATEALAGPQPLFIADIKVREITEDDPLGWVLEEIANGTIVPSLLPRLSATVTQQAAPSAAKASEEAEHGEDGQLTIPIVPRSKAAAGTEKKREKKGKPQPSTRASKKKTTRVSFAGKLSPMDTSPKSAPARKASQSPAHSPTVSPSRQTPWYIPPTEWFGKKGGSPSWKGSQHLREGGDDEVENSGKLLYHELETVSARQGDGRISTSDGVTVGASNVAVLPISREFREPIQELAPEQQRMPHFLE
ncbi:unnamed protein product [Vitrella brassicaformis CCMP3155]|uniref:Uncharacterized protein n=1 Tax=Vitrella brassicaformis (strain CCMP3155) TaxID=1169540 RepID=A0A0G4GDY0_VITBC|nr:unnamed protein product [Vitrella brassicaformis CCMP3155]|eukprot:CEM27574.1 unnamed protein product [Vitrella brassicaformis CCMP3155]